MQRRYPVVYKNKPYTPMKLSRCNRLVEQSRAKWRYDSKLKIRYLKLKYQPSGAPNIDMRLGWDVGSHFCGVSIVTHKCHHDNFEVIHNRGVKDLMDRRRGYRRTRRFRLRHRPVRNHNRTSTKVSNTNQTIFQERQNLVERLVRYYPITTVVVERVACRSNSQYGWTQVHQGQQIFIDYLSSKGFKVIVVKGYMTRNKRVSLFGFDPKVKNKASKSFEAHAVDSFSIACIGLVYSLKQLLVNTKTKFISSQGRVNRYLFQHKNKYDKRNPDGTIKYHDRTPHYFRYKKGGVPEIFTKRSKLKKIRVKIDDSTGKHGPWNYMYTTVVECYKKFNKRYGGSFKNGKSIYQRDDGSYSRYYITSAGANSSLV